MSRIIVKNLPKYINQERLSEHFKSRGQITDVKMVSRDGVFRRFAYIGFKTDEQAKSAIEHFNNTFFDTCRISVELAFSINSESLARPWSKYSTGSSAHTKQLPVEPKVLSEVQKSFLEDIGMDDPKLDEYLSVMKSKANEKTWGNDDVLDIAKHNQVNAAPADSEDELYDELPPAVGKQEGAIEPSAVAASISAVDAPISDMEYLRSKMAARPEPQELQVVNIHPSRLAALDESGAIDSTLISNNFQHTEQPQHQEVQVQVESQVTTEPEELPADIIADTARLMIKNLPYSCTTEDLETLFVTFGPITEVHIPISRETKSSRGYAFVLFMLPEHAMAAFTQLDQTIFQGRIIEITPAKEKPAAVEELPTGPQSFKAKREQDRKTASSSDFNWNSLFMNSDAVAEAMAKKLNVRKSDILDADADNMAVRLALAETDIINDTKEYLEEHGVCLDSFMRRKGRSNTIILVKNIAYGIQETELNELFERFGTIKRIVLPPARTLALVELEEPNEAKAAFRKLAYSKFKNLPLFLEWAPTGTFSGNYDANAIKARKEQDSHGTVITARHDKPKSIIDNEKEDADAMPVATVFVKNLNFSTEDDGLKQAFEAVGGLRSARVARKIDPRTRARLSMGFGFLEFTEKEDAMRCIKNMQKFNLDGHELLLKFSNGAAMNSKPKRKAGSAADQEEDDDAKRTKLLVKNIPFEATKKDLKLLFNSFGQVKSVRMPSKFDGSHRGFGFVEFLTSQEAKGAFSSLGATHLYGRHLVLEWAQDESSIETMRAKAAKSYVNEDTTKRQRVEMEGEEEMDY